jgi:predicted metal-binding protein
MLEANTYIMKCPFCDAPLTVNLMQVAAHEVVICTSCKKEIRLIDKGGNAKRAISDSYLQFRRDS